MTKTLFAAAIAAGLLAAGSAAAADLQRGPTPYYSAPVQMGVYNWTGPYAGLNAGYEWGSVTNNGTDPNGFAGGGQIGYNWQSGQFVLGAETDLQISGADDTFAPYKFSNPWFGTLRGRAGIAFNNVLVYGTGGFAYGDLKGINAGIGETHTLGGWAAGAGVEVGFAQNWSAKAEYLYMDLGSRSYTITGLDNGLQTNMLRIGLNYHF